MAETRKTEDWCLPGRVAYVVDHSYPYSSDGYAVRTHEVARALVEAGHDLIVFNRPGRPWDIEGYDPHAPVAAEQVIEGVRYVFLPARHEPGASRRTRLRAAEAALFEAFGIYRPGAVLGVSNWENAEPAQNAARRRGVPFFYEQRGFWEMSRAAGEPGYETTADYAEHQNYETRIAEAARAVFTINGAMRDELVRRGIPRARIHLVANGVSAPRAGGRTAGGIDRESLSISARYLLGYIGSLGDYEGSSDLVPLLARLRDMGIDADLLIVGSSVPKGLIGSDWETPTEARLKAEAEARGLGRRVHFVPQVPQERIAAYYGILDAVIVPRHRSRVTELVSPLKPYAAASHGVPVFMSDLPPLREIAPDIHASLFPVGDIEALAGMLAEALVSGDHPARHRPPRPAAFWSQRVAPMSRELGAAARSHPPLHEMLRLDAGAVRGGAAGDGGFDIRVLPRVALNLGPARERVLGIGPCAHLDPRRLTRARRESLLSDLATGEPGRFVIDWLGLAGAPGDWEGLWSIDNMRLNRQIMDACRIARDRGWHIEVTGPVARSRAPLFRTVAAAVEEVTPAPAPADGPAREDAE